MKININNMVAFILIIVCINCNSNDNYTHDISKKIKDLKNNNKSYTDSIFKQTNMRTKLVWDIKKLIEKSQFVPANRIIDSALKKDSNDAYNIYLKGEVFAKRREYDNAILMYNKALSIDTLFPEALLKRASILFKIGQFNMGLNDYKKASAINYDFILDLALAYNFLGKTDSATKYYLQYKIHYPSDTVTLKSQFNDIQTRREQKGMIEIYLIAM